jgi:Ca2+-binding RTX toxin-like protein
MYGGANNGAVEVMIGGAGNDHIYGESGIEELYGMNGDDYIDAGSDTDLAFGGYGNDQLFGGEGPDELHGDTGDDIISGGTGTDKLLGEAGDDILLGGIGQGITAGDSDELIGDVGFDLAAYYDLNGKLDNAVDLNNQNLVATPGTAQFQPFNQLLTGIEGAIGTKFDDQFGTVANPSAGLIGDDTENWLVGGSGNDGLRGNGGNDLIIGGSIFLDSLIGTYNNPDAAVGGVYGHVLADGTSHRVADNAVLSGGLLAAAGLAGERHFTDLLRSEVFKDYKLGDGGTDGTADFAVFSGNRASYNISQVNFTDSRGNAIVAYKVVDTRAGSPDGTDLVVGVEQFKFADKTLLTAQLLNHAPTGALSFTGSNNNAGTLAQLSMSTINLFDADNITNTNPLGTVTIPNASRFWQTSTDGGLTWTNIPFGNGSGQQTNNNRVLNQGAIGGKLIRATGSYTDGGGTTEPVASPTWNLIVGNGSNNNPLNGTTSTLIGDIIFGLAGADVLNGLAGNDFLFGGNGDDTLNGGDGNDQLDGGNGNDILNGGNGDDTYIIGAGDTISDTGGNDTIVSAGTFSLAAAAYASIENLTITGNGGNATGNGSANILTGNSGNNTLDGGAGADTMIGGTGNDTYIVDNGGDNVIENANGGIDTVRSSITYTLTANVENLVLTGLFNINGTGNDLDNLLTGNSGDNLLLGLGGNDRFMALGGNDGNDTYNGGTGVNTYDLSATAAAATVNLALGTSTSATTGSDTLISIQNVVGSSAGDTIIGNLAANIITGGGGQDVLTGGGGHDTFVFNFIAETTNSARDHILDFRAAAELGGATESDTIDLSGIDANGNLAGDPLFIFDGLRIFGNEIRGHVGFHYEGVDVLTYHTIIEGETAAGPGHNFQIDLTGHILLTAADFIL